MRRGKTPADRARTRALRSNGRLRAAFAGAAIVAVGGASVTSALGAAGSRQVPGTAGRTPRPVDAAGAREKAVAEPAGACSTRGDVSLAFSSGGVRRNAVLHVPPAASGPLPLIVAFHGAGGSGSGFSRSSGLSALADEQGADVVYPSSLGKEWAISAKRGERDVAFASALMDAVEAATCVDVMRIYAVGVSNGAGMAARVACELSARIAAVVLVAGGYRALPPCQPGRALSVLEVHGTLDTVAPYSGRGPNHAGAVLPYVFGWVARDSCNPAATKRLVAPHSVLYRWDGCASGALVEHLRIYGGGHTLPGSTWASISSQRRSPSASIRYLWHFLASRRAG